MTIQNFYYITAAAAIIMISVLIIIIMIMAIIVAYRLLKFSRHLSAAAAKLDALITGLKEKAKYSAILALMSKGLKEITTLIKNKRGSGDKNKK
ncbi:hypothetical protein IID20_04785 [Patescibacteria group bacterium]|nr:hypothetical protein [Patescibacteria group bacterium]